MLPGIPGKHSRQPTGPCVDGAAVFIVTNQPFLKGDVEKYTGGILGFLRIIFLDDLLAGEKISKSLVGRLGGAMWHEVSEFMIRE